MKKTALILFVSTFSTLLFSQRHSIKKEVSHAVTTITMEDLGELRLVTPADIFAGDKFSAGIKMTPAGKKEKDIARNTGTLNNSTVYLGNNSFPVSQINSGPITLTADEIRNLPVKIVDPGGKQLYQTFLPGLFTNPIPLSPDFKIPTHGLTGANFRVFGPFDGNSSTTKCMIGNQPAQIIAESPRQCIIEFPMNAKGPTTITIEENGVSITENISGVDFTITAGRMNLKRGESTYIDILITGLQNLPDNATLSIANITTNVVTMAGGNTQVITIPPSGITGAGQYSNRFNIQSLMTGDFSINIDLKLPEPPIAAGYGQSNWTACDLGVTTCILPGATCGQLQKGIAQKLNAEPLFDLQFPEINPYYFTSFNTTFKNDYLYAAYSNPADVPTENVTLTYKKIKHEASGNENDIVMQPDDSAAKAVSSRIALHQLAAGLYSFQSTGYYGSNQQYFHNNYVVVPEKRSNPTVRNSEIDRLQREEHRLRDSINNINRRIENGTRQMNENYKRRHYLDSLRWIQAQLYNELHRIDAVIEQIPGVYGDPLKNLLDSLEKFKQKAGTLNEEELKEAEAKLQQEVDDLEAALKACQEHLAALQKEQQDLKNEKEQIQKDQQQAYRDILDACRDAGYNAGGGSGHNKATGEFKYNFGLILPGANGDLEFVKGIPAQALKKVAELEKKIKEGNNRIRDINARQAELPGEIENAKKECDDIASRLAKAKEALKKGKNAVIEYNYNMADLDALCSEIKKLLEPLSNWCNNHPGECGSFQSQLNQLMEDCPKNLSALPDLMNKLNDIISKKKQVEDNHKKQKENYDKQIDDINKQNEGIGGGIANDQNKAEDYGKAFDKTMQDQDKAIADELARQQAAESAKRAAQKRVCVEFLKSRASSDEEAGLIENLAAIKDQIQGMAENVKTASEIGDQITKDKLKELTDKLREGIDKMMEEFEKFDKLKEKIDKWSEIKKDLETLTSGDESAKAAADKMGVILKRINEQLQEVGEKFPILQLFTSYFGFMVQAFDAIITGAYKAVTGEIVYYMEQALKGKINCEKLVNEYQKRNSLDDAVRYADGICKGNDAFMIGKVNNREKRRIYEEELKKYVTKMMMDCCLRYAMQ